MESKREIITLSPEEDKDLVREGKWEIYLKIARIP